MKIYLLRHGETVYNAARRYQGSGDIPLSEAGRTALRRADFVPAHVFVTPLHRTADTAAILFPGVPQTAIPGLAEMNFGVFEGRSADEMADDPVYRAWVDGGCLGRCPGGETRAEFTDRVGAAFTELTDRALQEGIDPLVIVAHGGVQMAVLSLFAVPKADYYACLGPNGGGWVLEAHSASWAADRALTVKGPVSYTDKTAERWRF